MIKNLFYHEIKGNYFIKIKLKEKYVITIDLQIFKLIGCVITNAFTIYNYFYMLEEK